MPQILVLANSRKQNGRCLAGIELDSKRWRRPVSANPGGALEAADCQVSVNGQRIDIRHGDIVEVPLGIERPTTHHPEDVLLAGPMTRTGHWSALEVVDFLGPLAQSKVPPLGCHEDRVAVAAIRERHDHQSLQVIRSPKSTFYWKQSWSGKPQLRATLYTGRQWIDLSVTDPRVENSLEGASSPVVVEDVLLTLSLAEPFIPDGADQPYCFTVIAAARRIR